MRQNELGRLYPDGAVVVHQGERGDCMFLVQKGTLEVVIDEERNLVVATLNSGDFFGEMSLFTGESRSAMVRSRGESRVLTIDEPALLKRLREDPLLAFRILETLCQRMLNMNLRGGGYEGFRLQELPPASERR